MGSTIDRVLGTSMFKTKKWLPPECVVPKSMGIFLWMSRAFGIAPVRLTAKPDGYVVRFSKSICLYGYAIIFTFALITMLALGFDLAIPLGTTRTPSETRRVMWVIDLAVVTIIAIVGGYQAPAHMRRLIVFVNRVQQITSDLHASSKCPKSSDDRMYCCVVFALIFLFTVLFGDLLSYIYIAIEKEERVWVAVMYSGYYCSNVITRLIKVQFMLTATYVLSALRLINFKLNNLQKKYDQYHVTSVGESDAQTIRHLCLSYGAVCKIIKEIDKSYGTVLLLLLGMMFLHLIVTLYYIINDIIGIDSTGYDKFETFTKPILQAIWCTFHTWNLFMIIEPSHKTHEEVERTRELISQFMCTLPLQMSEPLQMELEVFGKRLLLDCVAYSPHQVLTLTRSLVVTIFGSMTTYLVVIIGL
ncbi:gustatory receptor for sugar taste 43a-like [Manduca sexta]|uniref:gustatory receptor for sugar taste 43a-like n=1 Tax=Manduca sexta TaxID=7130 RepID=UPI00188DDAB2|nr:gustatory receptor for sugar taste 43a-like [Manduca sexta]